MYEHIQRDLDHKRTFQAGESNLQSIFERIVQRYSPQQARIADEWKLILQGQSSAALAETLTMEMGAGAVSRLQKEHVNTILNSLIRLWNSPPLSAFDLVRRVPPIPGVYRLLTWSITVSQRL